MTDKENETPMETAEEIAAEKEDLSEVKEDAIRENIIEEFGFDPEDDKDKERIDKAVKREVAHRGKLSKAVGQKIKYRDGYTKLAGDNPSKETDASKKDEEDDDLDAKLDARLDARDLAEMEYPEEIKEVIKQVAAINKISVKKAVSDPYVAAKIEAWKKQEGTDEAALSNKDKQGGRSDSPTDIDLTPPDVDLTTEEGRKEYDEWKENLKKQGV